MDSVPSTHTEQESPESQAATAAEFSATTKEADSSANAVLLLPELYKEVANTDIVEVLQQETEAESFLRHLMLQKH